MIKARKFILPDIKSDADRASQWVRVWQQANDFAGELFKQDGGWAVTFEPTKSRRTLSQNRMLWALYGDILRLGGEAMAGWTADDLHEFFLSSHFGTEKKEVFGKVRQVPLQRSAKLDRKQFAEFVDFIIRFMAQQGVVLGLPEGM